MRNNAYQLYNIGKVLVLLVIHHYNTMVIYSVVAAMTFHSTGNGDNSDDICIDLNDPVTLTFAIKYLNHFCRAAALSDQVLLSMHSDAPLGKCQA